MQESVNIKREGGRSRRQRQTKRQRVEDVGLICLFLETLHQVESSRKQPIREEGLSGALTLSKVQKTGGLSKKETKTLEVKSSLRCPLEVRAKFYCRHQHCDIYTSINIYFGECEGCGGEGE